MVQYSRGDPDAFDQLFHRHKESVYAFIRNFIHATDQVDDLFQKVFFRIIQNRKRYVPKAKFTTWLYTITRSVCIDAMREKKRAEVIHLFSTTASEDSATGEIELPSGTLDPRETSYQVELERHIVSAIQALPREQREVLLLREKTNMTFEEIGRVVGCSTNTVKSRMHYALLSLRKEMIKRGFEAP